MSAGLQPNAELEIAHVLFIDVVEYSRLLINEQSALLAELNQVVRTTPHFRTAEAAGKLIRIPVGDGMALVFFTSPEAPVQCALEICKALQEHPHIHLRMGIHSGPVDPVTDVNDRSNVAGAGMNIAQRIMDCADAGHILLSKRVAEDLSQYGHWKSRLRDLGEIEVKHGAVVSVFNLYGEGFGNSQVSDLKVISRNSVMHYRDQARNTREIGQALGVAHLLEGSVRRANDKIRITAQLIDARNDKHLWAEHYDRDLADVFAIQSEVA